MTRLEDLTRGASVKGILPEGPVTVINVQWHGTAVVELTYKDASGRLGHELLYRDREPSLEVIAPGTAWAFEGDGALFRLVSEAYRIRLAHLFDPLLAVHTSLVDPLPHQITAVYGEMLTRHPLRFLLADDPGAGKTIMAGLLIKELLIRGDLRRCLICCPASLIDQWQDELSQKFHLHFDIISHQTIEDSRSGNPYAEKNLVISRLDHMARNEDIQAKLEQTDWDLIVCDEAHKMSASFFSGEVKSTKRYKLGQLLGGLTRHLLLMTGTPHNGKEEEFQLFMALLDGDRFEGRFRDGVHVTDTSDLMRRLIKEHLLKFDGTPLFPERWAYTVAYKLSDPEAQLYKAVTDYVREEMNRADRLSAEGEGRRGVVVGFALTILQRRLASSPEAILQSIRRRRERLEKRLREERLLRRGAEVPIDTTADLPPLTEEDLDDLDDAPDAEIEATEQTVVDQASAARTIRELEAEILTLRGLEELALQVRRSGTDRKWEELRQFLHHRPEMFDAGGHQRKLIIFTEHRDTLNYLADQIRTFLGRAEAVVTIHGGMGREERRTAQETFTQDKEVLVLVATDAAGEGINLQRAHLMVNYDLPWNPNRIEQRFGRIHRIGQPEVCHLWNLVAIETREGDVFHRLFEKLDQERKTLGGQVYDVLGKLFQEERLRDLLVQAIRYGDRPDVRERVLQKVEGAADHDHIVQLLEERALARDTMSPAQVRRVREDMERAEARKLQPHFIRAFFLEALRHLGGSVREREPKRFEVTHVPAAIRNRDRQIGSGSPLIPKYERICFEKDHIVSRQMQFVEINAGGQAQIAGYAPYLDYRPVDPAERALLEPALEVAWLKEDLTPLAQSYAVQQIVPRHLDEVRKRQEELVTKTMAAVKDRLTKEINYWDHRAEELKAQELAGRVNARINSAKARARADDLQARLQKRMEELEQERRVSPLPPVVIGGALVVPEGLLARLKGERHTQADEIARETARIAALAMAAVLEAEQRLGFDPHDVSPQKCGYDIESRVPDTGHLRFIEVKGRVAGAKTVTITKNEILTGLNKPEEFILAIVEVDGDRSTARYVHRPFQREPDFGVTSVNYALQELLSRAEEPA